MDAPQPTHLKPQVPYCTIVVLAAAIIAALTPGLAPWLIYDRAAILHGQIWRLFTGHWVHLSASHLFYDSLAFAVAGGICENRELPRFGWLCGFGPWFIGITTLIFAPQMQQCGGLSGLAVAAFVYLALCGWQDRLVWRLISVAILAAIVGKITFEAYSGRMMFVNESETGAVVSVTSHIGGCIFAALLSCSSRMRFRISANPPTAQYHRTLRG